MQSLPEIPADRPQTPAQWAVRWHGLVAAALLAASVPLVHVGWHGILGREAPPIVTRSQAAPPEPTWAALQDGSYMLARERQLQEASPIVWSLRGWWNEALLQLGAPQSDRVVFGRDGWLFLRQEVMATSVGLRATAAGRTQAFANVRDAVRSAGAELLVVIVPDKSRVLPDLVGLAPERTAAKAPVYGELLGELGQLGIPTVDLAGVFRAVRAAQPQEGLFYRGDTHWRPLGALAAARAVAEAMQTLPAAARLAPRADVQLGPSETFEALGDLVAMLGLRTAELPAGDGRRTVGMSLCSHALREVRTYYSIGAADPALAVRLDGKDPAASVWLAGTSFTNESFWRAMMFALGRPVRVFQDNGASGILPMQRALAALRAPTASRPAIVVWEIVERGFYEDGWRAPGF
jgi:alginate O-acetyltransferase complex protein AlgJ